ncbi:hypothetical protein HDU97_004066 [Phlyctochytrium planicorne]|nr:hypothetical protein HDU97_004066 [Phlyctochytrium planicorne]
MSDVNSIGLLAGICIGLVGGLAGLVILVWWGYQYVVDYIRQYRDKDKHNDTGSSVMEASDLAALRQRQATKRLERERAKSRKAVYRMAGESGITIADGENAGGSISSGTGNAIQEPAAVHRVETRIPPPRQFAPNIPQAEAANQDDSAPNPITDPVGWFQRMLPIGRNTNAEEDAGSTRDSLLPPPRPAYNELSVDALKRFGLEIPPERFPRGGVSDPNAPDENGNTNVAESMDLEAENEENAPPPPPTNAYPPLAVYSYRNSHLYQEGEVEDRQLPNIPSQPQDDDNDRGVEAPLTLRLMRVNTVATTRTSERRSSRDSLTRNFTVSTNTISDSDDAHLSLSRNSTEFSKSFYRPADPSAAILSRSRMTKLSTAGESVPPSPVSSYPIPLSAVPLAFQQAKPLQRTASLSAASRTSTTSSTETPKPIQLFVPSNIPASTVEEFAPRLESLVNRQPSPPFAAAKELNVTTTAATSLAAPVEPNAGSSSSSSSAPIPSIYAPVATTPSPPLANLSVPGGKEPERMPTIVFVSRPEVTKPATVPNPSMTALLVAEAQARLESETLSSLGGDEADDVSGSGRGGQRSHTVSPLQSPDDFVETMTEKSNVSTWSWVPSVRAPDAAVNQFSKGDRQERRVVVPPKKKEEVPPVPPLPKVVEEVKEEAEEEEVVVKGLIGISTVYYQAKSSQEMDLFPGNTVIIFEAFEDGMGIGINRTTMVGGMVPLKHITFATSDEFPEGIFVPIKVNEVKVWKVNRPTSS